MANKNQLGMQQRMVIAIESAIETSNEVDDRTFPWAQRAREASLPHLELGDPCRDVRPAQTSPPAP
jgi:hypothetical protein